MRKRYNEDNKWSTGQLPICHRSPEHTFQRFLLLDAYQEQDMAPGGYSTNTEIRRLEDPHVAINCGTRRRAPWRNCRACGAAHPSHPSAVTIHEGRRSPRPGRQTGPRPSSEILQPGTLTLAGSSLPCTPPAPHCPVVGQHLSLSHRRKARKKKENGRTKSARELPRPAHMADGGGYHNNRPTSDRPASSGRIFRVHARRRGRMRRTP